LVVFVGLQGGCSSSNSEREDGVVWKPPTASRASDSGEHDAIVMQMQGKNASSTRWADGEGAPDGPSRLELAVANIAAD
jgi:hypothetical protein